MKCKSPILLSENKISVACGRCYSCKMNRRISWTYRLMCELKVSLSAYFITLTYDDNHVPGNGKLIKSDLQGYIKKIRKYDMFTYEDKVDVSTGEIIGITKKTRMKYFAIGEYGEKTFRPHYHILLFNFNYTEVNRLSSCWDKGFVSIGTVSQASIHYCTKDMMKPVDDKLKGFTIMSLKPAIGYKQIDNLMNNKLRLDTMVQFGTYKVNMPRYYKDKVFSIREKEIINQKIIEYIDKKDNEFIQKNSDPFKLLIQMDKAIERVEQKKLKNRKL